MVTPVKAMVWMLALTAAYIFAAFISPEETITATGPVGWSKGSLPLFNWKLFWYLAVCICAIVPLLSILARQWVPLAIELAVIGGMAWISWSLAASLQSEEELSGLQGWKETVSSWLGYEKETRKIFDTGPFVLIFATAFSVWIFFIRVLTVIQKKSLNSQGEILKLVLLFVAIASLILYVIGLHTPVFHSTRFWIMQEEVSLSGSVFAFFRTGETFLAVLIIFFTFVFPMVKFAALFWALSAPEERAALKVNKVLSWFGKWSMLDVFVIALLLVNVKLDSGLLDMELRSGMVYFSLSILLTMLCSAALALVAKSKKEELLHDPE